MTGVTTTINVGFCAHFVPSMEGLCHQGSEYLPRTVVVFEENSGKFGEKYDSKS